MTVKIIEKGTKSIKICDLMEMVKKNPNIVECGAIFHLKALYAVKIG